MSDDDDNVVELRNVTRLNIPAERVLRRAAEADLAHVIVIGYDKEGGEYFASSYADGAQVVWHCQRAIFKLMVIADAEDPQHGETK